MKTKYSIILLTVIIAGAFLFSFKQYFQQEALPYDDDQEGLNEQIVFTFSHVVAKNTPKGLAADKFAELVYEKSDGNIKIVVFPNGSLYSDIEEISALQEGHVDIIAPSTSKLWMISPAWGVLDLPYIFPSYEAIEEGLDGPIGQSLLDSLKGSNMRGLAHWSNGFKQFTTNKGPIIYPEDAARQTFRIMQSDVLAAQFDYLDVHSVKESFNSTYDLLDSGKVDGEENTISNIYSKKFYNLQTHLTISNHGYLGYAVIMNDKVWNEQSAETKRILTEAMEETTRWNRKHAIEMNEEQYELIIDTNIQIHELTDVEKQAWMEKLDPIYDDLAPQIGEKLISDIKELKQRYELENTVD
ncbi:tripartite ATP-independent transporter DctP family solute receptor [Cytobacillus horneckiae]|uniref:C4-dicarboxylate ABC transporter n=1 Tax=Cytobacillus horneckiae TaxID=549687 RepID=A0A2N0ZEK8_9BACI|nr:DctP family TRAP transporter solute-binding subunit [Cytobacillus horneckiae]MBN6888094.1 DctP family TRAP transporter solute-binding subunit [Cytobacillus horneckiae]MEC1154649.1 DctP family TRAP transporter solute-binding subunit [Cytobacillus horneckiae]MED2938990.1 DctP family TRAP transporter solute-binding subunit [Cytobacillus horneckiae]PKG27932.1 C4-dicarboxylate ABC transporter [Cytobacillus horneckiae]